MNSCWSSSRVQDIKKIENNFFKYLNVLSAGVVILFVLMFETRSMEEKPLINKPLCFVNITRPLACHSTSEPAWVLFLLHRDT